MELPIIWTHMEKGKINFAIDIPKMVIALVVLKMKLKQNYLYLQIKN